MATRSGAVHVATTTRTSKGKVYHTHLLRRTYREDGKVKHQTLGNISHLPLDLIEVIRRRLNGEAIGGPCTIVRSLPHGHVAAVLGTLRQLGLENILASRASKERALVVAMIVSRIISPSSKLATARALRHETAQTSLASELRLPELQDRDLYLALDWLQGRQKAIETKLARRHLQDGSLVLYDVSGSYYTGHRPSLVRFGHSRDGKPRFPQIVYGLICNAEGCPVAIEVFEGNTADPSTLGVQIHKVRKRFGIQRVVFVGDRGMITSRRIEEELRGVDGLDWITCLRADDIQQLAAKGVIQPTLFDERDLAEVTSPDYPDERLIVCRNPLLAEERARKREELLAATETLLEQVAAATRRVKSPLHGLARIGLRVGKVISKFKVGKHFVLEIGETSFSYRRDQDKIQREASLDGLYVVRTSVISDTLQSQGPVRAYKDLSRVERAFRCLKTVDLKIRPIFHWRDERIRAHVFLCMLSYYVEWHMRRRLSRWLFDDHERELAEASRESIVAAAPRSEAAKKKDETKRTENGEPVHSFQSLLKDLSTLAWNRVRLGEGCPEVELLTEATAYQRRIFEALEVTV